MYANSTNELGNKQIDMQIRDFMQIRQDMQIRHAKRSGFQGRLRPFSCSLIQPYKELIFRPRRSRAISTAARQL